MSLPNTAETLRWMLAALIAALLLSGATGARAAEATIAVAANFSAAAKEIANAFHAATGHVAKLSLGSSGQLYAQVTQGAPFDAMLSADEERPKAAIKDGLGVADSQFTYAIGRLVLWSKDAGLVTGEGTLRGGVFDRLAIANPATAPYGAAALQTLRALGLYDTVRPKLVQGNSIAQTFQFVSTGNAELGFVALAQVITDSAGSRWAVPAGLHKPIRQDAVMLRHGAGNAAATAFLKFLKGSEASTIIERYGYGTDDAD